MKKITLFIKLFVFCILILNNTIFVATGYDIVDFSITNRIVSYLPFLLSISIFATLPLIIYKKPSILIVLLTLTFFMNFLILLSQYNIDMASIVYTIFPDIDSQILVLLINSLTGVMLTLILLLHKKQDTIIGLHLVFVLLYFLIHFSWYFGIVIPQSNFPNVFIPRKFDLVYSLINIFKGTYLYISTMYIFIRYLSKEISSIAKIIPNNLKKYQKLIISILFGMFGIERLLDDRKKEIFIFQFLSAIFVLSYIITIKYYYFNIGFNLPLFIILIIIVVTKVAVNIYSSVAIIRE